MAGGIKVIVVVTSGISSIEGIGVGTRVLVRLLLRLAVALQGLPALGIGQVALVALASRVSCAQGAGTKKTAHRSTHHGCGCGRSPIRAGPTGAIARGGARRGKAPAAEPDGLVD